MKLSHFAVTFLLFAATACVDKDFNLNDISTEITVGGGTTTLPLGYLEKQLLGDIIELEDIEGLDIDASGNYAIRFEGNNQHLSIDGINNLFEIEKSITTFSTEYPEFDITGETRPIDKTFYLTPDFGSINIPYDSPIDIEAGHTITAEEEGTISEVLEYSIPEYLASVERIYLKPQAAGDKGARIDIKLLFRDIASVNGGGHITMELLANDGYELYGEDGNSLEVVDHIGSTTTYQITNKQAFEAGTEEIDFVVYVASIANSSSVDNDILTIPVELGYHISFDLTSRANTLRMTGEPELHINAIMQYEDADIVLNKVMLLEHGSSSTNSTTMAIDDLPAEIKSIKQAHFSDHSPMHLVAEGLDWIEDTTAEHIIIEAELPDYLILHEEQDLGYDATTHTLRANLSDLRHRVDINLDALSFEGDGITPENGKLQLDFVPDIAAYIEQGTRTKLSEILHDKEIEFSAGIDATTLELMSLYGKIGYKHQDNSTIEMGGIDDDIDVDIISAGLAPIITINVKNPITLDAEASMLLTPVIDGTEYGENSVLVEGVVIKAANAIEGSVAKSSTTIRLVDETYSGVLPEDGAQIIRCNLAKLLEGNIPDEINLRLELMTDAESLSTIYIADNYVVDYDYKINIPLVFNNKLDISIDECANSLSDTFEDLADQDIVVGDITLIADVYNTIPLDFEFDAEMLDAEGEPTAVKLEIPEPYNTIAGSKDGKSEAHSTLRIGLKLNNGGNINQLAEVDAIRFKLRASSAAQGDVALNAQQYIYLKAKLEIKGGINVDLDKL